MIIYFYIFIYIYYIILLYYFMIIHKCGYDKVHSQKEVRYIKNVDNKMTADCGNAKDRRTD